MQVGRPRLDGHGVEERPVDRAMSWPSISRTAQPKARHLSANGSRSRTSSTLPEALDLVVVDDGDEVVEPVVRGEQRRLPDASPRRTRRRSAARRPRCGRSSRAAASAMPAADGSPWPSEPVETSTPGTPVVRRVAGELRRRSGRRSSSQSSGKEAALGEHRVERGAAVALAQDEAVAVRPVRLARGDAQDARAVEHGEEVGHRQRCSRRAQLRARASCSIACRRIAPPRAHAQPRRTVERAPSRGASRVPQRRCRDPTRYGAARSRPRPRVSSTASVSPGQIGLSSSSNARTAPLGIRGRKCSMPAWSARKGRSRGRAGSPRGADVSSTNAGIGLLRCRP